MDTVDDRDVSPPALPAGRRLARRGRWLFRLACAVMGGLVAVGAVEVAALLLRAGAVAGMVNGGFAFVLPIGFDDAPPTTFVPITRFAVWQSTLAAGLLALRLAPGLVVLASLVTLFRAYARGAVFTPANERRLRRIAWALVAYALVPFVTHAALFAAGMSPVAVKFDPRQLDAAVLGVLLFAFGQVAAVGTEVERDRAGFV